MCKLFKDYEMCFLHTYGGAGSRHDIHFMQTHFNKQKRSTVKQRETQYTTDEIQLKQKS